MASDYDETADLVQLDQFTFEVAWEVANKGQALGHVHAHAPLFATVLHNYQNGGSLCPAPTSPYVFSVTLQCACWRWYTAALYWPWIQFYVLHWIFFTFLISLQYNMFAYQVLGFFPRVSWTTVIRRIIASGQNYYNHPALWCRAGNLCR